MKDDAADWQALKSAWQSTPYEQIAASALRGSLRWRIWLSRAWFTLEVLAFLFLGVVVALNVAAGQTQQAVGLGVVVAFCLAASIWARRGRLVGNLTSVPGMVELTLSHARKSLRIVYASYAVFGVTALAAFIDAGAPFVEDARFIGRLVLLTVSTLVTIAYHLYLGARIARLESIRQLFEQGKTS